MWIREVWHTSWAPPVCWAPHKDDCMWFALHLTDPVLFPLCWWRKWCQKMTGRKSRGTLNLTYWRMKEMWCAGPAISAKQGTCHKVWKGEDLKGQWPMYSVRSGVCLQDSCQISAILVRRTETVPQHCLVHSSIFFPFSIDRTGSNDPHFFFVRVEKSPWEEFPQFPHAWGFSAKSTSVHCKHLPTG